MIVKPSDSTVVVPEEVVMQPRFTVAILVLQAEGLVCTIRYLGFLFQTAPAGIVAEPQQIVVLIGYLSWDADLVAVEVVGLLDAFSVFIGPVMYLCQGFVAVLVRDFDLVAMSIWHRIFQVNQSWLVVPCYLIYNHEEERHYQPTTSRYGQSIPKKR